MKYEKYEVTASGSFLTFEFYSEGPKGRIQKRVYYDRFTNSPHVFQLTVGDVGSDGVVSYLTVTDNGDTERALATIAMTITRFLEYHPASLIYFSGSTGSRTRLYQIKICNSMELWHNIFDIFGLLQNGAWEPFKKGTNYKAFSIGRKKQLSL